MSRIQYIEDFEQADAGSSKTKPVQAGSIKKGAFCMLKDHPCKVNDYTVAKPGKHGSAKANIVGTDIFTGKKYQDAFPTHHTVYVPIVSKIEYEVADISESDFVSLLLPDYTLKEDLKLPAQQDLKKELRSIWDNNHDDCQIFFTVISACDQEKIIFGRNKEDEVY